MRRCGIFFALLLTAQMLAAATVFSDTWKSPRNAERKVRKSTSIIVLHTTEAGAKSSLKKLSERGEAHYCVDTNGTVYRIVDKTKEAFHAGRSMWAGKEDCDKFSIGIEVVGYHDKPVTAAQLDALKDLLGQLKKIYKLSDDKIVTHSQVAYAAPNKWHKKKCRGRKRCGMLFAMPSVRKRLGLEKRVAVDPDVRAKRLEVGDAYLEKVLYGKLDTMAGRLPVPGAAGANSGGDGKGLLASIGNLLGVTAKPAPVAKTPLAPPPKAASVQPKPKPKPKAVAQKPPAPKPKPAAPVQSVPKNKKELDALQGYKKVGPVEKGKTASKLAGAQWKKSTTYYLIRNKVTPGDKIDEKHIEVGTMIYIKK
ncbi:MAG: N-acetylmuramoyl-L-alanine amidase [Kiritimatiellae bacterium]|nr:N-acetylmuramoyl-L-alanine amidase [Kiritimatiellia bacterium]